MNDSPLLQLPAEVRNVIYTFVYQQSEPISICCGLDGVQLNNEGDENKSIKHLLAFTAVSKQIRSESLQLFYACNAFRLVSKGLTVINGKSDVVAADYAHFEWIWRWLITIGRQNCAALQDVAIVLGKWSHPMSWELSDVHRKVFMILGGLSLFFRNTGTAFEIVLNFWETKLPKSIRKLGASNIPLTYYEEARGFVENTIQTELALMEPSDVRLQQVAIRHQWLRKVVNNIFVYRQRQLLAVCNALDRFTNKRSKKIATATAIGVIIGSTRENRAEVLEDCDRKMSTAMLPGVTKTAKSAKVAYDLMLDTLSHAHQDRQSYGPKAQFKTRTPSE